MILLVISDLHIGKGKFLENGQRNILEDFEEDERLAEFLDYYSTGKYYLTEVHLVLNGDIFNLIQTDYLGVYSNIMDEKKCMHALASMINGHQGIFQALKSFNARPMKKITYCIGNHDQGMIFSGVQREFKKLVNGEINFVDNVNINGVYIEHGHRFEYINAVPKGGIVIPGPKGDDILNLPWGSLYCVDVLPILKKERPYIDKIRPFPAYVKWCFLHDFFFFLRLARVSIGHFLHTYSKQQQSRNKINFKLLKQITFYPNYARQVKNLLKSMPEVSAVIMGHTHLADWRKFPENKIYFNSGTWNSLSSIDQGKYKHIVKLTYVIMDINSKTNEIKSAGLNSWQGKWRPYCEEVFL